MRFALRLLVVLALLVPAVCLPAADAPKPAPQAFQVPMSDGTLLATDVYLPQEGKGPWPVIMLRTPYGRQSGKPDLPGYAIVMQDVRGRGTSQGHARPFFDDGWTEHQDGLDTVKWVLAQPWCNGRIGTMGGSALGITQSMLAGANPPGVFCQQIVVGTGNLYADAGYTGGMFCEALMAGWLKAAAWPEDNLSIMLAHPDYDWTWAGADADRAIWRNLVNIPAVHWGGWFDIFTEGTLDSFVTRSRIAHNQWLVIGPWPHGFGRKVGDLEFPPNAVEVPKPGMDARFWCDYWLRGVDTGLMQTARVHYYTMGACGEPGAPGNVWREAESWPVPATPTRFYLAPGGRLQREVPAAASLHYTYDPANPVPTIGGRNLTIKAGPMDQRPVEGRPDVLLFTTPPLPRPLEVTGRVFLHLFAASSAPDTAFTAKLTDVYPDGRSMLLTDGILRASCRRSFVTPEPLVPGQAYEFRINAGSTSIIFNRGHRIRLAVSSSNAPRFAAHPNTWRTGTPQRAEQTVFLGGDQASYLVLPVAPL